MIRPIQTRFRYGSNPEGFNQANEGNSPGHYAKGTPSHVTTLRRPEGRFQTAIVLRQLVGVWFQVLLTPLEGVLFIVRSRYWIHYRSSGST